MKKILLTALTAWALPVFVCAQMTISGKITGGTPAIALAGATVQVGPVTSVAGKDGIYSMVLSQKGKQTIVVSHLGFKPIRQSMVFNTSGTFNFTLESQTILTDVVFVSSTRAGAESASTFKTVTKADLEKSNFGQDLPFLLDNTPGVVVTSDAGAGVGYTGIRIRGSDATRVNVTLNGIPYNDSESQGTFWVNMPDFSSSVQSIQVQRGVGTSTNGAGAFGGSLNVQTETPSSVAYAELNTGYGSFNTLKNTLKLGSGLINNRFSFEGRLSRIQSNGFIDRAASNLKSFFVSGTYQNLRNILRLNVFSGTERTYQAWNGIPESRLHGDVAEMNNYISRNGLNTRDANNLLSSGNRTYNSFLYKDQTDNYTQNHYQLIYASQVSDKITLNGAAHYTQGAGYYEESKDNQKFSSYGLSPVVIGGTTITRTNLVRRRWLDNDFYGATFGLNHVTATTNFTLGGAYNRYSGDHFGQVIYADYGSNGDNNRHYYDNTGKKSDFNTFAKLSVSLIPELRAYVDLQFRHVNYTVNGTEKNLNILGISAPLNFFNPKAGISYTIDGNSSLYASFSVANKEPNRDDYINVNPGVLPLPEQLRDVELGYRMRGKKVNVGVNGYFMDYKNQLVITGKINDVGEYFRQNVPNSYRAGIELDGGVQISPNLLLNMNAALSQNKLRNYTEYIDDYDNGGQIAETYSRPDISFSPNIIVGGELVYTLIKKLPISLQSKYVGRQFLDNTENNARSLNGYWVNNLTLGYDFEFAGIKNMNVGLQVNNIFNEKYESNGYTFGYFSGGRRTTENFYFPQAGTNVMLRMNVRF